MFRSPSVVSYRNDDLSSPDPLADSINDDENIRAVASRSRKSPARRTSTASKNIPTTISVNTSSQNLDTAPHSPFRTVSEQNLSPWKIRVTVEAEPEDADMESITPMTRAKSRTKKVPVQAPSSPTEHSRPSTRGRKSQANSGSSKRSGTPVRGGRNSSRSRRQSVTDLNIIPLGDDSENDDWLKQKNSPRKRRNSRKSTPAQRSSSPAKPKSKANNTDFEVRADTDAEAEDCGGPGPALGSESPELQNIDLNQVSIRPRAQSTKSKPEGDCPEHKQTKDQHLGTSLHQRQLTTRKVSANSAMSYPTPSPTSSYHGDSDNVDKPVDEPVTNHGNEAFDTMLESEGFTMIDLDTLPSARYLRNSPSDDGIRADSGAVQEENSMQQPPAKSPNEISEEINISASQRPQPRISYPVITADESDLSSTVPSSPPALAKNTRLLNAPSLLRPGMLRKVTPQPYSSPKLPSPPRIQARRTPQHRHRESAGALFAGIALQEVVSPSVSSEKAASQVDIFAPKVSGQENSQTLFKGFDPETQRELRAGLRFGEELAKRQIPGAADHDIGSRNHQYGRSEASASSRAENAAPESSNSDLQSRDAENPRLVTSTVTANSGSNIHSGSHPPRTPENVPSRQPGDWYLDTIAAQREREYQLEREAISRQIQNASESQVIVIDSDSDEEPWPPRSPEKDDFPGDETDIWLAEARGSSSPYPDELRNPFAHAEQAKQKEKAKEVANQPRRSLIPSPWKRGEDVKASHDQGSFLSTKSEEMSGLMAYSDPDSKLRFGAGQIKRQQLRQKRNSGKFDIDLMAGTPKKSSEEEEPSSDVSVDDIVGEGAQTLADEDVPLEEDKQSQPFTYNSQHPDDESTLQIPKSSDTHSSSPSQPVKIPVNFNDSSISFTSTPPPPQRAVDLPPGRSTFSHSRASESPPRPPTPRSALKGSRESFHQGLLPTGLGTNTSASPMRRVVFSERSRGVDVHGQESSFSMRSSSSGEDSSLSVDDVGKQLRRELFAVGNSTGQGGDGQDDDRAEYQEHREQVVLESAPSQDAPEESQAENKGWTSWIWGSKKPSTTNNDTKQTQAQQDPITHPSREVPKPTTSSASAPWQPTKLSLPSSLTPSTNPFSLPSYLLPPSYPSDPTRQPITPLSPSGDFTNTHFRTLHIIYRKSLRPKFHPPARVRDEVWALRGRKMVVDESRNGVGEKGEFVWTLGDGEVEVLERFMQEVEYSNGWFGEDWVGEGKQRARGIQWGWSVKQLAEWLCRIVVGEVVREEERKARERK